MTGATIRRTLAMLTALAVLALAAPAFAQSGVVRGKVLDAQGTPVEGAQIKLQNVDNGAPPMNTKSNKKGEYMQVGLTPGHYKVTATKGDLTVTQDVQVHLETVMVDIKLVAASGPTRGSKEEVAAAKAKAAAATTAFNDGVDLTNQGKHDEAIAKFQEVIAVVPNCVACYTNIGTIQGRMAQAAQDPADRDKNYADAEASFKTAIDKYETADATFKSNPDNMNTASNAYTGLANVYNAEKKFDLAVATQQKAGDLMASVPAAPGAAGAPGAAPAGNANSVFNQGVILWNAGKIPEAKAQFEQAVKIDPNLAEAHYWLGMALVNAGNTADAKPHFETYLKLAPDGQYADTAKAILATIK